MTTLTNIIDEIEDDTERSDTDAIRKKVLAAIRHYQPKRLWFNESRSVTFTTSAGVAEYSFDTIGAEFYKIDGAFLTSGSSIGELCRVDYTGMEAGQTPPSQGTPSAYAYIDKAVRLAPVPDDAYNVRLTGHVKLAAPSTDTDDSDWFDASYDLIMARAKSELYAHRWEDPASAALMRAAERDALNTLLGATHDKVAPDHLEATDF